MIGALLLSSILLGTPASAKPRDVATSRLEAAQERLAKGDLHAALRLLASAAGEARDDVTASRIYLLRGQAYAALRDEARAEAALARALEHDPEAVLEAGQANPRLVAKLDELRRRQQGDLRVRASIPGARIYLDGKPLGTAPVRASVAVGPHTVEVRSADGRQRVTEQVVVRQGRLTESSLVVPQPAVAPTQVAAAPRVVTPAPPPPPVPAQQAQPEPSYRPFVDLRLAREPLQAREGVGVEVGGGLESQHLRASLHARAFPFFGLTLRGAYRVPLVERLQGYAALELPVLFSGPVAYGVGGAVGAEYGVGPALSPFLEVGARHLLGGLPENAGTRFSVQGGVRLRLP